MRKSQIKMGETIAVLIVFFILLLVGMVFYAKFKGDSIERKREEMDIMNTIEIAIKASRLPELQCTTAGIECGNTIDLLKLQALEEIIKYDLIGNPYYDMFYASEIVIEQVYPTTNSWILYNFSGGKTSVQPVYVPVTIHDVITDEYSFGFIRVGVYV